jgi:hypothetical protein
LDKSASLDVGAVPRRSTSSSEAIPVTLTAWMRFVLMAVVLSVIYYYSLVFLIGWMNGHERPGWWLGMFPTRLSGALAWVIMLHTATVLFAALPVAVAAVAVAPKRAVQLGLLAAVFATFASILPMFGTPVWSLVWRSRPILFVTDQIKLIVAVPLIAWILLRASSKKRFERARDTDSLSQGGGA